MSDQKQYLFLNVFLAKTEFHNKYFEFFLSDESKVNSYNVNNNVDFDGMLYVKRYEEKKPKWSKFIESLIGNEIEELLNKSSSAVLVVKVNGKIYAFTFGYGRFLINLSYFEPDFGIKTALNTLRHDSLRSVDLYTIEDQPVQKKTQAVRESEINVFGIDISKDILRAVTGSPKEGINFNRISGGDAVFSFAAKITVNDIPVLANLLEGYYQQEDYKENFYWVDNIRTIKDQSLINELDHEIMEIVKRKDSSRINLTATEPLSWDKIYGFSFTRSKSSVKPTIEVNDYFANIDPLNISIDSIKRDKLFVIDIDENEYSYSVYKCIYFEKDIDEKTYILFGGVWYELDKDFKIKINNTLNQIPLSDLNFPEIYVWDESGKLKIETEGDYNERVAKNGYYLLDKKLIRSSGTTSPIELCDLMTLNGHLVHVKHRKGGSSGLSHLFAQGNISAEVLLGDRDFRKATRKVLRKVDKELVELVPIDGFSSNEFKIVYLILGKHSSEIKETLPFFSKVNLAKTYKNLCERGYTVSIGGVDKIQRPPE